MSANNHSSALNAVIGVLVCLLVAGLGVIIAAGFSEMQKMEQSSANIKMELTDTKSRLQDIETQNEHLRAQLVTVQGETQAQTQERILKEVSEKYDVPKNERPNFAQVKDTAQLPKEAFFDDAKNGDYMLIYPKAKLTILYRPSENKIITTAPIELTQQ